MKTIGSDDRRMRAWNRALLLTPWLAAMARHHYSSAKAPASVHLPPSQFPAVTVIVPE